MRVYVINLDRSEDRWNDISARLEQMDIEYERIPAIDGKNLDISIVEHKSKLSSKYPYGWLRLNSSNEVACNLSHAKALQTIANGADTYGVILEDDAIFSQDAAYFLKDYKWIPQGTKFIKLDDGVKKVLSSHYKQLAIGRNLDNIYTSNFIAVGYIVSRDIAQSIAERLLTTAYLVDSFYYNFEIGIAKQLNYKQLNPAIITHDVSKDSTIIHSHPKATISEKIQLAIARAYTKRYMSRLLYPHHYKWGKVSFI